MAELTQERLKEVLLYNPETGIWTWLNRPDWTNAVKSRFVGKPAGSIDPDTGYLRIRIDDILYYGHRLAFLYMTGEWPADQVDHKNLDRADCRWENLREANNAENNTNKPISPRNKSGFRGVCFDKWSGKWVTNFKAKGKRYRQFGFTSPEAAYAAYLEDVARHGTEFHRVDVQVVGADR